MSGIVTALIELGPLARFPRVDVGEIGMALREAMRSSEAIAEDTCLLSLELALKSFLIAFCTDSDLRSSESGDSLGLHTCSVLGSS